MMPTALPNIAQWIQDSRFYLVFQPLISLSSGHVMGYEVLTRPLDEHNQPIAVEPFFQQASTQGLAVDIDRIIVRKIAQFIQVHDVLTPLFVNLHPDSLMDSEIHEIIQSCPSGSLIIEITERGNWVGHVVNQVVERFRHHGGTIALDDFGTGYSGLEKLVAVRPNFVKLDRSLIAQCHMYPVKRNLIASVSHMARFLGFQLIAEGIETHDELLTCIDLGVEIGQGFYFAKPVTWDQVMSPSKEIITAIQQRQQEILESSSLTLSGLDPFRTHWALMMEHLVETDLTPKEQMMTMMATAFKILQPTAMTVLRATDEGLLPIFSLGHSYQDVIPWDSPSLAIKAFQQNGPVVLQKKTDVPENMHGPIMHVLSFPESVALFPIGKPTWGVLGADYMGPYKWSDGRLQILKGLAYLMSLLLPQPY